MRRRSRSAGLVIAALACLMASLVLHAGQTPPSQMPTFRAEVRFVEVDAVVRDEDGNFIADLAKDDFEILEDGQPQEIAALAVLNLPVDRSGRPAEAVPGGLDAPPIPIDSFADAGRIYVMILDSGDGQRVKDVARQFIIENLGPRDLMAILHTGNPSGTQGLTNDKDLLLASVRRYVGIGPGALASFRAIKDVAVNLNSVSGRRKAILFVGGGSSVMWLTPYGSGASVAQQLWREYDDAAKTAARNNVRIYPVDASGLMRPVGGGFSCLASGAPPGRDCRGSSGELMAAPQGVYVDTTRLNTWRAQTGGGDSVSMLRLMAEDTGGIAIVNTNNIAGNLRRVVRDNSAYYMLGYYSPAGRDGNFHRITVRLRNRPDLSIRGSRSGYLAAAADVKGPAVKMPKGLSTTARDALRGAAPVAGLPIEVFTAVFRAEGYEGSVLIGSHVPGAMLKLAKDERIELSYVAVDRWGKVRAAERRAFTMNFTDAKRASVEQTGLRLFGRLRLPRGRYQIRVAAHQAGGATGLAVADVEIPDFADLPLSVSDLVIASSDGPTLTTLEEDAVLRRSRLSQPTPARRFAPSETLTTFGEIYDSHWILSQSIGVTGLVRAQDGRLVMRDEQTLASGNRGRFYYTGRIPLASFAPGTYTLTVEAHTSAGVPASASQQLRFEVE
jgi:VWFA-related protein